MVTYTNKFRAATVQAEPVWFDAAADIDKVLTNSKTGCLDALFDSDNTLGGPGDGLHPNRAGHAAMANEIFKAIT